jgi:hypothetical protein
MTGSSEGSIQDMTTIAAFPLSKRTQSPGAHRSLQIGKTATIRVRAITSKPAARPSNFG